MNHLLDRIAERCSRLLPPGCRVLAACSGGPDSQGMLHILASLRERLDLAELLAAGVDHGLRPQAGAELDLAAELADTLGVPFHRLQVTVNTKENTLAAARRARLGALRNLADTLGADRISLGHTATDRAETVLLFLARGASLRGASSMRPRRGRIVRPLLEVERGELQAYNRSVGLRWAEDPGNADLRRARGRLRLNVLPELAALNAAAVRHLGRFADRAAEDDDLLQALAKRHLERAAGPAGSLRVDAIELLPHPLTRRVIAAWLRAQHLPCSDRLIAQITAGLGAGSVRLSVQRRPLRLEAGRLWVYGDPDRRTRNLDTRRGHEHRVAVPALECAICTTVTDRAPDDLDERRIVAFDADRLHLPLTTRAWRPGDKLKPFGHPGHVTVGNLFTNEKIPRALRRHWPLVLAGDEVLWVAGVRRGAAAPVTTESRNIIVVSLQGALPVAAC